MRYTFSLFIYRLLLLLLLPVVILLLVIRSHSHTAYRQRILERLGFILAKFQQGGIVVHAASVGEVIALKPFIEQLLLEEPNLPITLTTFTPTGSAQVQKIFSQRVQHCYLPLDVFPCTWLFLKKLKPKALVLMETELWPNLIAQCHQRNIKLQLINARLSDKSMRSYRKIDWLIKPCLQRFDNILSQSEDNQQNFLDLGANKDVCQVAGNLKFDLQINPEVKQLEQELSQVIEGERKIWLVASTHPGDEQLILKSFTLLKQQHDDLLLILVPRHPERFESVYQLCQQHNMNTVKRSSKNLINRHDDIWLIDTLGELLASCGLADVVTMGGSFSNIGGHNPLEPALFKKAIVVGHDMANFKNVMTQLHSQQGIEQLSTDKNSSEQAVIIALSEKVGGLFTDQHKRDLLGGNAFQVVHVNQGASERSMKALLQLL